MGKYMIGTKVTTGGPERKCTKALDHTFPSSVRYFDSGCDAFSHLKNSDLVIL